MAAMAVDQPLPGIRSGPDDVVALTGSEVHSVSRVARTIRQRLAVTRDHDERPAMNVRRVVHWHGLIVSNAMDGPAKITQDPIERGGTYHLWNSYLWRREQSR